MPAMHTNGMDMSMMAANPNDPAPTKEYKAAMMGMMEAMPMTFSGAADIDFMRQMRPHHQGAIDMAKVVLAEGEDPQVKAAQEIIKAQEKEIATIDAWLKAKGN